jgi:hypothetical protein
MEKFYQLTMGFTTGNPSWYDEVKNSVDEKDKSP